MLKLPVYLDNNATTQVDPRVLEAMIPYFTEHYGNAASRSHSFGWEAEEAVDYAREQVAQLIGAEPKEIIFTSGATEADNLALKGVSEMYASKGDHIITVFTEHKAVLDSCKHIEKLGGEITYLNVNKDGLIDLDELRKAIKPNTILIAVMYANNEIGVIQPIKEISAIARKNGILFFSDATQAAGKIPIDVNKDGIDLMAFSAHKMYGPKGVGALYIRRKNPRVKVIAQIDGGGHERNMRSGTLNVPGIVGFGKACELCRIEMKKDTEQIKRLRDKLESGLLTLGDVYVNGSKESRLPSTVNLSFKHVVSEALMLGFNKDIAVSSGSACTSATLEPSYVLKALGVEDDLAKAAIRFGLSRFTTELEIDYAIERVAATVSKLRDTNCLSEMTSADIDLEMKTL
ncbi:IscS subfamily cysteine desulfurase [Ginsengibacter hankyongi]|uniref:Cysteine desulfurase IscS n=1 Tax=Ginsengibacter hankyongi TaxID=2607284 RepID=A0A5J5IL68_9BACT|nr:IscS subfamily cysteine desulfurase [Ginsengibacter hankyongi]KAA9041739.1 IscS subfamily cysteine desulfurase [Ginsengibacter hankyongi]